MEARIPRAHHRIQSEKIKMLYVHLISNFMLLVDDISIQREGVLMMERRSKENPNAEVEETWDRRF